MLTFKQDGLIKMFQILKVKIPHESTLNYFTFKTNNKLFTEIESTSTVKDNTYTEKRNRCLGKYWQTIPALLLVIEKYSDYNVENNYENCVMIKVMVTRHFNPLIVENCILKLNALGVT